MNEVFAPLHINVYTLQPEKKEMYRIRIYHEKKSNITETSVALEKRFGWWEDLQMCAVIQSFVPALQLFLAR